MGVLTYTFPTSTLNFMTFTAKRWGYYPIITLVGGGIAGQEVATTDASHNIFVTIQGGVSTNTQVKAAIDSTIPSPTGMSAGDYASVVIASGHETDVNVPGASPAMTGAAQPDMLGFFTDQTLTELTTTYQYLPFGNIMGDIVLSNDDSTGSNRLSWSWDGINVHGLLSPNQSITYDKLSRSGVYVKYVNGSPLFKIIAMLH